MTLGNIESNSENRSTTAPNTPQKTYPSRPRTPLKPIGNSSSNNNNSPNKTNSNCDALDDGILTRLKRSRMSSSEALSHHNEPKKGKYELSMPSTTPVKDSIKKSKSSPAPPKLPTPAPKPPSTPSGRYHISPFKTRPGTENRPASPMELPKSSLVTLTRVPSGNGKGENGERIVASRSSARPPSRCATPDASKDEPRAPSRSTTPDLGRTVSGTIKQQHRISANRYSPMLFSKKEEEANVKQIVEALAALKESKSSLAERRAALAKLTDVLGEDQQAIQQRLRVLLHPLQQQLLAEVDISKDVCNFLQTLARYQPKDALSPSYNYFAGEIITQLLQIVSSGLHSKREFVLGTLERMIDSTRTKDTLGILICHKHTHNQSNGFLLDIIALVQRAVQNWDPEFFRISTVVNMMVEPLVELMQAKSEKVQAASLNCIKQLGHVAPIFEKRVINRLPAHLKGKVPTTPAEPSPPPVHVPAPAVTAPPPTKKSMITLKTPKKLKQLMSQEPKSTPPPPPVQEKPKLPPPLSKCPEKGAVVEVGGMKVIVEKLLAKSLDEGGVYRVYHPDEDAKYAYKIIVGDTEQAELNSLLTLQGSPYVIKVINSEVEDDGTIHLITEMGEVNMEDYILDNWDKWTHNKIRSIAEEIFFAIRDIHTVSLIHGDITPRNFVLVKGSLKVIDFGLARSLPPGSSSMLVPINQMKGSPDFLPPEVFRTSRRGPFELYKYSSGVDVWAAGVILHLMATGLTPFAGMSDVQIAELTEMPPIKNLGYPLLQDLLGQMLSFDITARPTLEMILAHPFFGTSPVPSLTRMDTNLSKYNRLSVSSTSSAEGFTDSDTNTTTNSNTTSSAHSSFLFAPSSSTVSSSIVSPHSSPITSHPSLLAAPISINLPPLDINETAHDTTNGNDNEADNPLAMLTPKLRHSNPRSPASRVLSSQDSKLALFGNLFGPTSFSTSAPPAADVGLSSLDSDPNPFSMFGNMSSSVPNPGNPLRVIDLDVKDD